MKRKYLYVLLACMTISAGIGLTGCGSNASSQNTNVTEASNSAGVNNSSNSSSATTTSKGENAGANSQSSSNVPNTENGSQISMGTIQSIDTDNNTITISAMQGFSGFSSGNRPGGNNQPDGFDASNFQGQVPDGFNGQVPDNFDASYFQGQVPDGFNGQVPDNFDASNFQGQVPDGTEVPSQKPGNDRISGESITYTVTEQTVIKNQDGTAISLSDLGENSFVQFTAEDNIITNITVANSQNRSDRNSSTN